MSRWYGFVGSINMSRMSLWYGRAKVFGPTTLGVTLGVYSGWKARAAWEEAKDASKSSSVLARLTRVPGYFSKSGSVADAKDLRITELEGKLHAADEKNLELQMCLDAQSNRHEFLPTPTQPQRL